MIPLWKLKREWARLKQQLSAIPEALIEPGQRRRHDAAFERGFAWSEGDAPQSAKIALLLIYQPSGVAQSTRATCAHLVRRGYAPFIVSNAPLTPADHTLLNPVAWRIMERPNFGYDFGGYRDGIRQLDRWSITPERLLILNDSIWFPLRPGATLIDALERSEADLTGTILRERGQTCFLESYCYMIPGKTVSDMAFRAYWDGLKLTSNKYKVIRRGERGFSRAMIDAGLSLRGLFPYDGFLARLAEQDDSFLQKTLTYAAHSYAENAATTRALLADPTAPGWRDRALAHIAATLPREQPYSTYPFAMVRLYDYPILKKSNDRVARLWRAAYLRAIKARDLPAPNEPVLSELRCQVQADMP